MTAQPFDIFGGYKVGVDNIIDPQSLGNMYVEVDEDAPQGQAYVSFPGTMLAKEITAQSSESQVRASFTFNGKAYVVVGSGLYELDDSLNSTLLGTLQTTEGTVNWATNLTEILLVDGAHGYLWNGTTFTTDPTNFPSDPVDVTYLDGFFLVAQSSTNKFFRNANQEDGSTWDVTDFAELTTDAQKLKAIAQLKRRVIVFGSTVAESWYPVGGSGFGFLRDNNVSIDFGCVSASSLVICKEFSGGEGSDPGDDGVIIWLGQTPQGGPRVLMTNSGQVIPLSNIAVEIALQKLTDPTDCSAYTYKINGHVFYEISFTTDNKTFVYDLTTKMWCTKFMVDDSRYFANTHFYFNNKHYFGAYNENKIYEMREGLVTNKRSPTSNGEPIKKVRIWKNFKTKNGHRMMVDLLEIEFRQGYDPLTPQEDYLYWDDNRRVYTDDSGNPYYNDQYNEDLVRVVEDPVAYLAISDDGGETFGFENSSRLGGFGDRRFRTFWGPLGVYNSFIGKLTVYDNIGLIIIGANWDVKEVNR